MIQLFTPSFLKRKRIIEKSAKSWLMRQSSIPTNLGVEIGGVAQQYVPIATVD